jgi:hypothetical protein
MRDRIVAKRAALICGDKLQDTGVSPAQEVKIRGFECFPGDDIFPSSITDLGVPNFVDRRLTFGMKQVVSSTHVQGRRAAEPSPAASATSVAAALAAQQSVYRVAQTHSAGCFAMQPGAALFSFQLLPE